MKNHPYKNFVAFTVTPGFILDLAEASDVINVEQFEEELQKYISRDPSATAWRSAGLVSPVTDSDALFHTVQHGTYLLAVQFNERILPGKVRDEHLRERIASVEEREGRKVYRKEYAQLRDEVEAQLLPKAFIRRSNVYVMFTGKNKMFVFTSSAKRSDETLAVLRDALPFDTAKCRLLDTVDTPDSLLRSVAEDNIPHPDSSSVRFEADDAAVLHGSEKRTIRVKDRDIYGDEVQELIASGYTPSELRMTYGEDGAAEGDRLLTFTLNDKLFFKRIQFTEFAMESASEAQDEDDARSIFNAFTMLVSHYYSALVNDVIHTLGGLEVVKDKTPAPIDNEDDEL